MAFYLDANSNVLAPNSLHKRAPSANSQHGNQVKIRPYESFDHEECRELFAQGMWQLANPAMRMTLPRFLRYAACLGVLVVVAALKYALVILAVYVALVAILASLLYIHIYMECYKFIGYCLTTDLMDIDKSYMANTGSHMWVAEWKGRVVGMVGVLSSESHEYGVVELQRMSVSTSCRRMGIAKKLLQECVNFSKMRGYEKMILSTTGAQKPAISLYKKAGFSIFSTIPHPASSLLRDLPYNSYELKL